MSETKISRGWNQPIDNSIRSKGHSKSQPSLLRGLLAGSVIVALVGIVLWWLWGYDKKPTTSETKNTSTMIKEVKPSIPKPTKVEQTEKEEPLKEIPYWERETTNGLTFRQLMKWKIHHRPPATYTNNTSQTEAQPAYAIFNTHCENEIACLLTMEPGSTLVGDPSYERWFTRDFLKSLETPIVVTEDDTPEQAELKQEMIKVKSDLKARYDAGEDIAAIMRQTREEYQSLARYKNEIEDTFREMTHRPGLSESDVDDFLEAANKMLESKGIAPMTLGPIAKQRLLNKIEKMSIGEIK